jgi:hypothetical protein
MSEGLRFKFIERTGAVENHRGIGAEDGLIRIEFEFEKEYLISAKSLTSGFDNYPSYNKYDSGLHGGLLRSKSGGVSGSSLDSMIVGGASYSTSAYASSTSDQYLANVTASNAVVNDVGITVGGSVSSQKFSTTSFIGDGKTSVLVMKIKGEIGETKVEEPITVKTKTECPTCGTANQALSKFCTECGTGLVDVQPHKQLPSRYAVGDWVVCKNYKHMVKYVKFGEGKVYYGLAFGTNLDGDVIEYPSEDVYPAKTEHARL